MSQPEYVEVCRDDKNKAVVNLHGKKSSYMMRREQISLQ